MGWSGLMGSLQVQLDTMTDQRNPADMTGTNALVVGIANEHSYAFHIAKSLKDAGANLLFTHLPGEKMERRVRKAVDALGIEDPWLMPLDAASDDDLDAVFAKVGADFGRLDVLVHSIAFADKDYLKEGRFTETPRDVFTQACDISAFTKIAMAHRAKPLMTNGGSILSLSYYGAERAVPGYNVMGVAKAALESATRYLAAELGPNDIRVNSISGGPLKTLSAMAVGGFSSILANIEEHGPLRRNVTGQDVGETARYLLSDMGRGVTGQIIRVDCGTSAVAGLG